MKSIYYLVVVMLISTAFIIPIKNVYGHGLGGDMAPPIDFGGQNISIETRIEPQDLALYKIEAEDINPLLKVRFFNYDTNINIEQTTMRITVEKDEKILMSGWFYDPNGEIKLQIIPTQREGFEIYGDIEPQLAGYYNIGGAPVQVSAPIFLEGGLYRVSAEVRSALTTKQLLNEPIRFDTWISVADDNKFVVSAEKDYEITVRTYYDNIVALELNDDNLTFEMPFNWDDSYIKTVPMVHEELIVPKEMGFASTARFDGYVNGIKLDERMLIVDPYSYQDKLIIHFVLDMNTIQNIKAQAIANGDALDKMKFELVKKSVPSGQELTSLSMPIDNGKVKVIATLPAQGVFPQQESEITLTFFNMDNSLLRDIRYNVKFFDENNNMIFETDRYTPEGIDVIKHTFEKEGMVTMQINVIGSGFSMQKIDTSIAGTAETSISVVPEFPVAVVIISIGMIAAIAIARRNNILKVN
ncbi:MAG: hypothetical protein QW416_05030 [Candidatus Nitrosocaldaceae archaeon]